MLQLGFVAAINLFCSPLPAVFCFQARFCVGRSVNPDYPEFDDTLEGPSSRMNPSNHKALDYVRLLWPTALCELIAVETNRYAFQRHVRDWTPTSADEIWAFLGTIVLMGYHTLPSFEKYWSNKKFSGVPALQERMTFGRFRGLWGNLHIVDNETDNSSDKFSKVGPVISYLSCSFSQAYDPGQCLSIDETMIKSKGRAKGKVCTPKKPVKHGFKMYCLSCSCCGYLCNFLMYSGKYVDPVSGKTVKKKGEVANTVKELVLETYSGKGHVLYMDRFFTSGPLVEELQERGIYTVGTIKRNAAGFPKELRDVTPEKGKFLLQQSEKGTSYYVYNDNSIVAFVTNVFSPPQSTIPMYRLEKSGAMSLAPMPPLVPAYNKWMGGVDRTNQRSRYYSLDHRCSRPWMRIFLHLFDVTISNAYILYKHNCRSSSTSKVKTALEFREELVEDCLENFNSRKRKRSSFTPSTGRIHEVVKVEQVGLKRGRCSQCKKKFTSYACAACRARVCVLECPGRLHKGQLLQY